LNCALGRIIDLTHWAKRATFGVPAAHVFADFIDRNVTGVQKRGGGQLTSNQNAHSISTMVLRDGFSSRVYARPKIFRIVLTAHHAAERESTMIISGQTLDLAHLGFKAVFTDAYLEIPAHGLQDRSIGIIRKP
jgi:hypothetical protein